MFKVSNDRIKKSKISTSKAKDNISISILALPGVLTLFTFCYLPMFGVILAFKNFHYQKGIFGSPWVGFDNFMFLFKSNDAYRILRNTLGYNIMFIVVGTLFSIFIALLLARLLSKKMTKVFQTMMFMPNFISWVVVGYMALAIFSYDTGIANNILQSIGLEKVNWYMTTKPWWAIFLVASVWKGVGFSAMIYYGTIIGIDASLYEAADIDGATEWKKTIKITIPLIKPTIIMLFILALGGIMRADFGLFYYLPNDNGMLYEVTDVIDTYIYRSLKVMGDVSTSTAVGLFQSVVGLILVVATNTIVNKYSSENSLF